MILRELYESRGVDYDEVLALLRKEDRIKLYLVQTVEDPSFASLAAAMERRDYEEAFRAAHTVKGMCMNLMLEPLTESAVSLVECLRGGSPDPNEAARLFAELEALSDALVRDVRSLA